MVVKSLWDDRLKLALQTSHNGRTAYASSGVPRSRSPFPPVCVSSAILSKLAKHLVVFACLAIVGEATDRSVIGQVGILFLIVAAALLHSAGRILHRRFSSRIALFNESS
jgi:hypothetical protein